MRNKTFLFLSIAVLLAIIGLPPAELSAQAKIQYEKLADGVERWYRVQAPAEKPWFFQQLENIFDVILPRPDKLPFGKSVAFLVGVSDYQYLTPDLPFVKNDLLDMREFLLNKGGFDEVYVASEKIVDRYLIEDYIRNKFSNWLKSEDRLLFYFSGHGADAGGKTGYMQFSGAKSKNFAGPQILPINDITDWCDESHIRHLFFILDCCASGLAFTHKGNEENSLQQTLATLSQKGSRIIFTAGTADEQTFEVTRPGGKGNGVFTRALLNALDQGVTDKGKDGFLTAEEIFARAKDEVTGFVSRYKKNLTPRWWQYDDVNYRGTFIFLNQETKIDGISLSNEYSGKILAKTNITDIFNIDNLQLDSNLKNRKTSVFRSHPKRLTENEVKLMLLDNNFFCKEEDWNVNFANSKGKAYNNKLEIKNINNIELIIDLAAGLMWHKLPSSNPHTFENAHQFIKKINDDRIAGFDDWRIPTLEEAMSLVDVSKNKMDCHIDSLFENSQNAIWTSDLYGPAGAWMVIYFDGICIHQSIYDGIGYVRAVRSHINLK